MPKGKIRTKQDKNGNREERHCIDLTQFKVQLKKKLLVLSVFCQFTNVFILEAVSKDV